MIKPNVYFLGIGGIGMSALAQYFLQKGHKVAGYDRIASSLTQKLSSMGAEIHLNEGVSNIPKAFTSPEKTMVVRTPAIPSNSEELSYFQTEGFEVLKRAEVLGALSRQMYCIAVAGTHGKTTTSAILTHLLRSSGKKITAFLGGVAHNIDSNYVSEGDDLMVVEADEFDRSFLQLQPDLACVTAMDADHLDIYGGVEALESSFKKFVALSPTSDNVWIREGIRLSGRSFGSDPSSEAYVDNIRIEKGQYLFDFYCKKAHISDLIFPLPGHHNLLNAAAALCLSLDVGCAEADLREGLKTFSGIDRRFSKRLETPTVVIDDYAHHPEEIKAMHEAVRTFYPSSNILAVFQPHLFSRTRDFCADFASSLSMFDQVMLLEIYPARELPIEGISARSIAEKMPVRPNVIDKQNLATQISAMGADVVVLMGAGDIADEVETVVTHLKNEEYVG
jgi:UDP-N-acetylmuramate--alanine ligase